MRKMVKTPENVKKKPFLKCMFSYNSIHPLPREGFVGHIPVTTITTFWGASPVSES